MVTVREAASHAVAASSPWALRHAERLALLTPRGVRAAHCQGGLSMERGGTGLLIHSAVWARDQ